MESWNHDLIIKSLLDAGELALDFFKKTKNTIKKDGSIVTEADIAVEKLLKDRLQCKTCSWIGEESSEHLSAQDLENALNGTGYIVDPIDGTLNYANGLEMWGISIGYLEKGNLIQGAVYLPCMKEIYITHQSTVKKYIIHNNQIQTEITLSPYDIKDEEVGQRILSVTQAMAKNEKVKYPGPIHSISSAVYTICKLMSGCYYGYVGKLKIWDLAAVYPMCKILDIEIFLRNGHELNQKIDKNQFIFNPNSQNRFSAIDRLIFCPKGHSKKLIDQI